MIFERFVPRSMLRLILRAAVAVALAYFRASPALADAGWFDAGDRVLRNDLQLLNDAGVIRLPVTQWPVPRAAVKYALENAKEHFAVNRAVMGALDRVKARVAPSSEGRRLAFEATASAGEPGLLRDFNSFGRETAEVGGAITYGRDRAEISLQATGAVDPADGHRLRVDGSHATVHWGNWLLSAHTLDRWWGPANDGSLILSTNARPMPTLMVERAAAIPFETPWLSWIGPWRMSFGVSRMETHREDTDSPLFLAWRVTIVPFRDVELGFSRTAQFCGKGLECNFNVFGNLLAGNDNVGIDATPENEPGNQMAGFDLRWNSPIGNLPYAIYSQMIGEDESSYLPAKYLAQFGAEVWGSLGDGGVVQGFVEYANTSCSGTTSRPRYGCAYRQGRFFAEGYRYEGRVIGHTTDRDSRAWSLGANYTVPDGSVWSATARSALLNRTAVNDRFDPVAQVPTNYAALELGWRGRLLRQEISVDAGVEAIEPDGAGRDVHAFGFVGWHHDFR
jgi:hypothetical protein